MLLIFFIVIGVYLCKRTVISCGDNRLSYLPLVWILKIVIACLFVRFGWQDELARDGLLYYAYDAKRYYYESYELINNKWVPHTHINSSGILYYYALIFYFFGHSPYVSAIVNSFVTLLAVVTVFKALYKITVDYPHRRWVLIYILLIPDLIWYDSITAREGICASLLLMAFTNIQQLIKECNHNDTLIKNIFLFFLSCTILLLIRSTMLWAIFTVLVLLSLFLLKNYKNNSIQIARCSAALIIVILAIALRPIALKETGSKTLGWVATMSTLTSAEKNAASTSSQWSEKSLGKAIIPDNLAQAVVYLPIRMMAYLLAPIPNIPITREDIAQNRYSVWQNLCAIATSLLIILIFPYCLLGIWNLIPIRKERISYIVWCLAFLATWACIAGGNFIIQDRYRSMMLPLLFIFAWFGFVSKISLYFRRVFLIWITLIILGVILRQIYRNYF